MASVLPSPVTAMRFVLACLLILGLSACTPKREPADLVITAAKVHTLEADQPVVEAVAVKDGRIIGLGTHADMLRHVSSSTRVLKLNDATVYPGFTDAHMHLTGVGERELTLNLEGTKTREAFLAKVAEAAARAPAGTWIVGRGWIETHWTPSTFPTRQELDGVARDHLVYLTRADGHAAVVNTRALKEAGVSATTPAPFGGAILKDADGEPNGMLIDNAQALVASKLPPGGVDPLRALQEGIARSQRLGWTGVQDAGVDFATVERLRALCAKGELGLRWYGALDAPSDDAARLIEQGAAVGECDGLITLRALKFYMDGALGSRGAALLKPYSDAASDGLLRNEPAALADWYARALKAGIQVETHAIGDRGNRIVLDLYEQAFAAVPQAERKLAAPRWRIEHAQVLDAADLPRFAALGVIPSMQPSHAIGDLFFAPARLGAERLAGAYAWRTLIDSGVMVPAGSDAPVEQGDPRIEFYAAAVRKSLDGQQLEGWHPELAMTRDEALRALTLWPAHAAFEESERGTLKVGKRADFTIFDRDLLTVPEAEILTAQVVATVVGGTVVYQQQ
jgi:predicted amidohydrolase YtcJ